MAVRIRMKRLGRKHRSYFRIVAIDSRQPRDGRIIEELGSYDPMIKNTDDRVKLNPDRIKYWMGVGAKPSERSCSSRAPRSAAISKTPSGRTGSTATRSAGKRPPDKRQG